MLLQTITGCLLHALAAWSDACMLFASGNDTTLHDSKLALLEALL
jgi:hypothetical protein